MEIDQTTADHLLQHAARQTQAMELTARLVTIWFGLFVAALVVWGIAALSS